MHELRHDYPIHGLLKQAGLARSTFYYQQQRLQATDKHAELKISALMRRLDGLRDEVGFEFRPRVEAVMKRLSDVHDQLISDIMSRKKQ